MKHFKMLVPKLLSLTSIFFMHGRSLTVGDEDHMPDYHYTFDGDNWIWTGPPDSELSASIVLPPHESEDEGFIGEASHTFMKVKELLEHGIIELWPNGLIPYRLSEQFTKKEKADIETAIQIIEQHTCLKYERLKTTDKREIMLDITSWKGGHCLGGFKDVRYGNESRTITRLRGFVKLDQRGFCRGVRLIIHELFHALGFSHMQKRPDRDEYIKVNWENVAPGSYNQFKITEGANFGLPYDCSSVMHYSKDTFSGNGKETMTPIHQDCHLVSGREWENVRPMLSPGDVKAISIQYSCSSAPSKEECKTTNGKTCVFPFIYKGVKYSGCTTVGSGGTPWCSTVTDKDGNYIDHPTKFLTWGNCDQNCRSLPHINETQIDLPGCSFLQGQYLGGGHDVAEAIYVKTNEDCKLRCESNPSCDAWTRHQITGYCQLKSQVTTASKEHHPAFVLGTKCGTDDYDYNPYDYFRITDGDDYNPYDYFRITDYDK